MHNKIRDNKDGWLTRHIANYRFSQFLCKLMKIKIYEFKMKTFFDTWS